MGMMINVIKALDFAARKHRDQRRKGAGSEPYINHLTEVAFLVAEATEGGATTALIAALLHDTIEDTITTREELEQEFGSEVAALVVELTDNKLLPKLKRKQLQVENSGYKSEYAKLIKIADKISNLRSICLSPPVGWDVDRQREYFVWAFAVVAGCRGVNKWIERRFDEVYEAGLRELRQRGDTPPNQNV